MLPAGRVRSGLTGAQRLENRDGLLHRGFCFMLPPAAIKHVCQLLVALGLRLRILGDQWKLGNESLSDGHGFIPGSERLIASPQMVEYDAKRHLGPA
jgi:hypothetical protein